MSMSSITFNSTVMTTIFDFTHLVLVNQYPHKSHRIAGLQTYAQPLESFGHHVYKLRSVYFRFSDRHLTFSNFGQASTLNSFIILLKTPPKHRCSTWDLSDISIANEITLKQFTYSRFAFPVLILSVLSRRITHLLGRTRSTRNHRRSRQNLSDISIYFTRITSLLSTSGFAVAMVFFRFYISGTTKQCGFKFCFERFKNRWSIRSKVMRKKCLCIFYFPLERNVQCRWNCKD